MSVLTEDWTDKPRGIRQYNIHACITLKKKKKVNLAY